jgi:NTE family protein
MTRPATSGGTVLVLGGGGARGAAQVGVLRALAARGVEPDACVGTSVGALNAAVCAAAPLPEAITLLERIWATPETRRVLQRRLVPMVVNQMRRRPYLRSGEDLRALVRRALELAGVRGFNELQRPLHVVMTDLLAGEKVVAAHGSLEDALCASASVPGLFPPVRVDERLCVDGGVTENCALATAATLGADRVIAIDLTWDGAHAGLRRLSDVIGRMQTVALQARLVADFDRFSSRLPVTLICPRPGDALRSPTLDNLVALRDSAAAAAERLLQRIATPEGEIQTGLFPLPLGIEP